jgi:hypothetical protein
MSQFVSTAFSILVKAWKIIDREGRMLFKGFFADTPGVVAARDRAP